MEPIIGLAVVVAFMLWDMWKHPLSDEEAREYIGRMRPRPPFRGNRC